jgi:very-short-patch-repair endonuclease
MQPSYVPPPLAGGGQGEGETRARALLGFARSMRKESTPAERKLWQALRNWHVGGLKFRRQVPLGNYIADFYCPTARLVIEVDGETHIDPGTDVRRDAWMESQGITVFRVTNQDVLRNLEGVVLAIQHLVASPPSPIPLPQGEGG